MVALAQAFEWERRAMTELEAYFGIPDDLEPQTYDRALRHEMAAA